MQTPAVGSEVSFLREGKRVRGWVAAGGEHPELGCYDDEQFVGWPQQDLHVLDEPAPQGWEAVQIEAGQPEAWISMRLRSEIMNAMRKQAELEGLQLADLLVRYINRGIERRAPK